MRQVSSFPRVLVTLGLLCILCAPVRGQTDSLGLPEGWQELSAAEFVEVAKQALSPEEQPSQELTDAIRSEAARRLLDPGTYADADYSDLSALYEWGRGDLTAEQQETVHASLRPPMEEVPNWDFEQLESAYSLIRRADVSSTTRLVVAWLKDRDISSLTDSDQVAWLLDKAPCRAGIRSGDFSVRFSGFVKGPSTGSYTFSICPINVNYRYRRNFVRQQMAIWIGGRQVLDSTTDGWSYKGTPVQLQAGEETSIRVEFSYARFGRTNRGFNPAVARLLWEGPGLARTLVPSDVLSPPHGSGNGLQAEYRLVVHGKERTVTRTEPAIDHTWYSYQAVVPKCPELRSRLAERLWSLGMDQYNLAVPEGEEARRERLLAVAPDALRGLSSSQQAAFVEELLARPALLEAASLEDAIAYFRVCRIVAPDRALDLLGEWAQMHPDAGPELGASDLYENRECYRLLATQMLLQYRPHLEMLKQHYLDMPDGSCCLPVAYGLAYSYWADGQIREWIATLDGRLEDEALVGDRRVNWLLARAQAEEIRRTRPARYAYTLDRFLAGRRWLDTACLTAQSGPVGLRAYKELIVRLTTRRKLESALELIDAAAARFSEPAAAEVVAGWREEVPRIVDQLQQEIETERQQRAARAEEAYAQTLKERYQRAVAAGDEAGVSRYRRLLSNAGVDVQ